MQPLVGTTCEEKTGAPATTSCRHKERARPYQFRRDISDPLYVVCAILYRSVLRRAIYIALIIGTSLMIIIQGDVLLTGAITSFVMPKMLLTYTVPYSVSTFSALWANRVKEP